ncbi:hypothetical protein K1T71_006555 [Dendrolimus kikuchii]|uniref:Uncharacterized protein n=1 Tax=Dendrolimus kikuchii TaxID=765133 RepID=A0ACC1D2R2_9NEOP|nr:hypothetical protein K1T71_006555 [Dendrolimus kikuchii]
MSRVHTFLFLCLIFKQIANANLMYIIDTPKYYLVNSTFEFENNELDKPVLAASSAGCANVGEFCNDNSDCCSNSCLGFLKRCVSGEELVKIIG